MNIKRIAFVTAAATAALLSASGASAQTVAIVTGGFYTPDLKNQLVAKGYTVAEISSYSAATLGSYSAVIQDGNSFVDQAALTSYVTAGGHLVLLPWSGLNYAVQPQLQIFANGGSPDYSISNPGINVLSPGNSLLTGVTLPAAGTTNIGRISGINFVAGATQVASWSDGTGMLGYRALGAGEVYGLNLQLITSDTAYTVVNTPWASKLIGNIVGAPATAAVPEPATWAMMLVGFGAIGGTLRRRQKATARIRFA